MRSALVHGPKLKDRAARGCLDQIPDRENGGVYSDLGGGENLIDVLPHPGSFDHVRQVFRCRQQRHVLKSSLRIGIELPGAMTRNVSIEAELGQVLDQECGSCTACAGDDDVAISRFRGLGRRSVHLDASGSPAVALLFTPIDCVQFARNKPIKSYGPLRGTLPRVPSVLRRPDLRLTTRQVSSLCTSPARWTQTWTQLARRV